jgi:hypothetical protein
MPTSGRQGTLEEGAPVALGVYTHSPSLHGQRCSRVVCEANLPLGPQAGLEGLFEHGRPGRGLYPMILCNQRRLL